MVKRYVAESGSDLVRAAMHEADYWYVCRVGFVETVRVVGLVAGKRAAKQVREEWASFGIVEVDQELTEHAAALALANQLRSLDALHLAAALLLPAEELILATWDRHLHRAAVDKGLQVLPEVID